MRTGVTAVLSLAMEGLVLALATGSCGGPGAPSIPTTSTGRGTLTFGVSPGGSPHRETPADVTKTTAALRNLRAPDRPFVVHLYSGYAGPLQWRNYRAFLGRELGYFERAGFDVELVLRYAPFDGSGPRHDVRGFVALVRRVVETFGKDPRFISVQITNEPDRATTAASDGYFNRGNRAWEALIQGVIAAKTTARAKHFDQLQVGFNYASADQAFWRYLGRHGGPKFRGALDWIGIDAYPGTRPPLDAKNLQSGIAHAIGGIVWATRRIYMPLASIPARVALHFSENGYATSGGHSYAMQAAALKTAVETVASLSRMHHVTEFNWFELRDTNSSIRSISNQLGLLQTDYQPKPAFGLYRRLVRDIGPPQP